MSKELYFSKSHEWIEVVKGVGIIGLSDHAQHELGDIVFLEVTKESGDAIEVEESFATVESVKAVSDIYCPVSGTLMEINQNVIEKPELINSSPQDEGWIIKVQLKNQDELKQLLNETDYKKSLSEQ